MGNFQQVIEDLRYVFRGMPLECLYNLRDNRHRLIRGKYSTPDGGGCIFSLLTEPLAAEERIDSRESLIRYFGGDSTAEHYQPAKWIVRLWDHSLCEGLRARYGDCEHLSRSALFQVLDEIIAERTPVSREPALPAGQRSPRCESPVAAC